MAQGERDMRPIRIRRLAMELRGRRRRLSAFAAAPDWPGKGPTLHSEQLRYDQLLLVAAQMLDVPAPEECPFQPAARAVVEDALAIAGLDVFAPSGGSGDPFEDGDLVL
ncbi:MAG: hypothetical protein QOE93_19 [Actinomycetota bacterium]|jgi:hypothetical protein|nr:hypothetical protein [Actinomycetota bacterium]